MRTRAAASLAFVLLFATLPAVADGGGDPTRPIPETLPTVRVDLADEGFSPGVIHVPPQVIEGYQSQCDEHVQYWYDESSDEDWIPWAGTYTQGHFESRTYTHETPVGDFRIRPLGLYYSLETTQQDVVHDLETVCTGPRFTEAVGILAIGTFEYVPAPGIPVAPMDFEVHFPELLQFPGAQLYSPSDPYAAAGFVNGNVYHPCWYSGEDVHWIGWRDGAPHIDPTMQETTDYPIAWPAGNRHTASCDFPMNPAGLEPWADLDTKVPIFVAYLGNYYCSETDGRGNEVFDEQLNAVCGPAHIPPEEMAIEFRVLHPAAQFAWRFLL